MKNFLLLIGLLLFASCTQKIETKEEVLNTIAIDEKSNEQEKPYANPYIIYGSSFGEFFQAFYRQGDFEQMVKFTHSSSVSKHGIEQIKKRYASMKFNFVMKLQSGKKENDSTYVLNYTSNVIATRNIVRLKIRIENDSAKVLLPDKLSDFPE